jgi:hypothetical protein
MLAACPFGKLANPLNLWKKLHIHHIASWISEQSQDAFETIST